MQPLPLENPCFGVTIGLHYRVPLEKCTGTSGGTYRVGALHDYKRVYPHEMRPVAGPQIMVAFSAQREFKLATPHKTLVLNLSRLPIFTVELDQWARSSEPPKITIEAVRCSNMHQPSVQ